MTVFVDAHPDQEEKSLMPDLGGAVRVKVTAAGKFIAFSLDPEFLKEDAKLVADVVLAAIQDASRQAKELNDNEMQKVTAAFQMPGML